jgi:2-phosphosulfolactate phosphatase
MSLRVFLSWRLIEAEALSGATAVVIDLLRASTTIVHAIGAGAAGVVPCEEVEEARLLADRVPAGERVLGGERGGVLIPEFDLGNSPREYTRERVGGKTIVFTTTNGTRALKESAGAGRVIVGCFANFAAVARAVRAGCGPVVICCAGVSGQVCLEDAVCAGAFVEALADNCVVPDDPARMALASWRAAKGRLAEALRESQGGRNLAAAGLALDLVDCAAVDTHRVVPVLDQRAWRISAE